MMFWMRVWVRATLWRFSTLWNCWIIFKLACGLQGFNLGGQILGNLLNGFISGEEVEDLVDISAKDVNAPEFFNQFDLEDIPVGDIVEGSPLVHWDGLEGDDELDRVVAFGEVESVQNGGQPWVEIVG